MELCHLINRLVAVPCILTGVHMNLADVQFVHEKENYNVHV